MPTSPGFCFFQHGQAPRRRLSLTAIVKAIDPSQMQYLVLNRENTGTDIAVSVQANNEVRYATNASTRPAQPTVSTCWCTEIVPVVVPGTSWCVFPTV